MINYTIRLLTLTTMLLSILFTSFMVYNYFHESTHIRQVQDMGLPITEICYLGHNRNAIAWVMFDGESNVDENVLESEAKFNGYLYAFSYFILSFTLLITNDILRDLE